MQKLRFELAHASRVAVAGELTGAIAHEINQPLAAILSNADAAELLLASGSEQKEELNGILADIRRDNLRASAIIHRLRALIANQPIDRRPLDLNGVVGELEILLRNEAQRRGVSLELRPAQGPAMVLGDRIQIQQVILNLVLNAMDAVAELPEARRRILVAIEHVQGRRSLLVRDEGPGVAPEHLPRLFDSFFTTKQRGMGLGLPIVRTLAEANGARIQVESQPGQGALFRVDWPAGEAEAKTKTKTKTGGLA